MKKYKPKVIDLFAGIGGMSLGFEIAGCEVVFANEYDKSIAYSYKKNHPTTEMLAEDITNISLEEIFGRFADKIDIVIGGPPCQGFSQKGQRKTINDKRNFLFKHYIKVVSIIKPKFFVMENVPNLLTAEKGFFKKEIEQLFGEIGYKIESRVLNAADYGIPQNRKRAFVVGNRIDAEFAFPNPKSEIVTIWDAISDLAFLESGQGQPEQLYRMGVQTNYQTELRESQEILLNHQVTNHSKVALERLHLIPPNCGKESLPKEHLTKSIYSGTWTRMVKDEVSATITTRFDTPSSGKFTHPYLNRAITVREAARIQSFPDRVKFFGSKTSQMKQVGNAVPPLLAKAVAEQILKILV